MKKFLLLLGPVLFSLALQGNVREMITPEKPVQKTVRFSIYASSNYSKSLYKQSKAKIILSIWRYKGRSQEQIWEGTVDAGRLRNYPSAEDPLFREVNLFGVKEHKEMLVAAYKVMYDSKGSTLAYDRGYIVPVGDSTKSVTVRL
ncbi:hypothetical protein EXU57_17960 [Segetibacter sp. 3557_3]|uniref:hypothetical protein n=1 Tax=Segetibacter sp. 3557_3 TaxID=2547429 RepID=UPI0010583C1A|nr:hypothetical protein [Segetibacter sp. 3557_3]TDH23356.1 hypothetical protein EXU57_17960 [Segetibacter sp. 3557_3]